MRFLWGDEVVDASTMVDYVRTNWKNDPEFRGVYSYYKTGEFPRKVSTVQRMHLITFSPLGSLQLSSSLSYLAQGLCCGPQTLDYIYKSFYFQEHWTTTGMTSVKHTLMASCCSLASTQRYGLVTCMVPTLRERELLRRLWASRKMGLLLLLKYYQVNQHYYVIKSRTVSPKIIFPLDYMYSFHWYY